MSKEPLVKIGQQLQTKVKTPVSQGYRPELDASPELSQRQANYFWGLIGVLRWIIELGGIDIMVSVAMLSCFLAAPREGHLNEVLHISAYLKEYDGSSLVFDHQALPIDEKRFDLSHVIGHSFTLMLLRRYLQMILNHVVPLLWCHALWMMTMLAVV
jgi:hypothetical protein